MVLVEHAAESITPSDVEVADSVRLGDGRCLAVIDSLLQEGA